MNLRPTRIQGRYKAVRDLDWPREPADLAALSHQAGEPHYSVSRWCGPREYLIHPPGRDSDPLSQTATVGWKQACVLTWLGEMHYRWDGVLDRAKARLFY